MIGLLILFASSIERRAAYDEGAVKDRRLSHIFVP
jgi:hypothetical protein